MKEYIDKKISVCAYVTHQVSYVDSMEKIGQIGRARTGLFKIAEKFNIPVTPISIDYIYNEYNIIPYQRFEIRVSDSFYVTNYVADSIKVRKIFSESLIDFKRKKFMNLDL